MKIWVDNIRPGPEGYYALDTVNKVKNRIMFYEDVNKSLEEQHIYLHDTVIELIDLDHDAGDYYADGGDYIEILNWLEETGRNYPIRIHSQNPVEIENMRRIIKRNGWTEVK